MPRLSVRQSDGRATPPHLDLKLAIPWFWVSVDLELVSSPPPYTHTCGLVELVHEHLQVRWGGWAQQGQCREKSGCKSAVLPKMQVATA